jgi:hypothetical protein
MLAGGQSALEFACCAKKWNLVHALVNAGTNINAQFHGMSLVFPISQNHFDFKCHLFREGG